MPEMRIGYFADTNRIRYYEIQHLLHYVTLR
jgi:hypothetical protein